MEYTCEVRVLIACLSLGVSTKSRLSCWWWWLTELCLCCCFGRAILEYYNCIRIITVVDDCITSYILSHYSNRFKVWVVLFALCCMWCFVSSIMSSALYVCGIVVLCECVLFVQESAITFCCCHLPYCWLLSTGSILCRLLSTTVFVRVNAAIPM